MYRRRGGKSIVSSRPKNIPVQTIIEDKVENILKTKPTKPFPIPRIMTKQELNKFHSKISGICKDITYTYNIPKTTNYVSEEDEEVFAIATIFSKIDNMREIDVICAQPGYGRKMFDYISGVFKKEGIEYIILCSVQGGSRDIIYKKWGMTKMSDEDCKFFKKEMCPYNKLNKCNYFYKKL